MNSSKFVPILSIAAIIAGAGVTAQGCVVSGHPVAKASWGVVSGASALEAQVDVPGELEVETVIAASWDVQRSGLLNLEHPRAEAAGLEDQREPISIYFHALRHPARGLFVVDTGIEQALVEAPERAAVRGFVADAAGIDRLKVHVTLRSFLAREARPLAGVFLTHLHLDHIMGLPDVPRGTPVFTGPGEARAHGFMNVFVRTTTDRVLEGHAPLGEWQFQPDPNRRFAGVLDVFGDGSLWAIHVPGHTAGSTAYLARTPRGPVLMVGDACHTSWGWEHQVEPGTFSSDQALSAQSLKSLAGLVQRHPRIDVRLGHHARGQALASRD